MTRMWFRAYNECRRVVHIKKIHSVAYNANSFYQTIKIKMTALPKKIIGCIGKCTSGLNVNELDMITDHIHKTLNHCKGKHIFREFIRQGNRADDMACLDFYEKICVYIENDETYLRAAIKPTLVSLTANVEEALDVAVDLNGVPEIDLALLERYNECLTNPCREAMLDILTETKYRLADHLTNAHTDFKVFLLQPCPKTK